MSTSNPKWHVKNSLWIKKRPKSKYEKIERKMEDDVCHQLSVYHTLIETYNIIEKSSSEKIRTKIVNAQEKAYHLRSGANRDLRVPAKPRLNCQGFSYCATKLYNKLPTEIRTANENGFKSSVKAWIWENIPSI